MNDTQYHSVKSLQKFTLAELDRLARATVGDLARRRLMLGRYLLVLGQEGRVAQFGCSGAVHYAGMLQVKPKEALECRRVALCLEALPCLRESAEAGRIGWCALSKITRTATPETDERWNELAQRYTYGILKKLVNNTPCGQMPGNPDLLPELQADETWLHMKLPAHVVAMFQRALRQVSLQAREPVSTALCLELVVAEFLSGTGNVTPETLARLRGEAHRDVQARSRPVAIQLELEEAPEPPLAALAGRGAICPSDPSLKLVVPDTDTAWQNPRLRFSGDARLTTPAQRREVLRRDGYCCSTPGCPHKLWLAVHHVVFYCQGGVTLPPNLVVVCTKCHRNIHKGRLRVTGSAPAELRWTDRRGRALERPREIEPEG